MGRKRSFTFVELLVVVLVIAVVGAMLFTFVNSGRHTSRPPACASNLKQLGLALTMYATENKEQLPPIDDTKNNFMFDADVLFPEYLNDASIVMCPQDPAYNPA